MKYSAKRIIAIALAALLLLQSAHVLPTLGVTAFASGETKSEAEVQTVKAEAVTESKAAAAMEAKESKTEKSAADSKVEKAADESKAEDKAEAATEESKAGKAEESTVGAKAEASADGSKAEEKAEAAADESKAEEKAEASVDESKAEEKVEESATESKTEAGEGEAKAEDDKSDEAEAESKEEAVTPAEAPEEVAMPAVVLLGEANGVRIVAAIDEGTFPQGVAMKVKAVSSDVVKDAVESKLDGAAGTIKAVDISFSKDGKELQPAEGKTVHITMSTPGMDASADHTIMHVSDAGNASVIDADVNGNKAAFDAEHFSIYLVVEEDQTEITENAVATYEFYVGDELVSTQYMKTGDKLTDPGSRGADEANTVFKGWFIGESAVDFDSTLKIDTTEKIRVDAKIDHTYYITFWGEKDKGSRGIVAVKSVTVSGTESGEVTTDDILVTPKNETGVFKGWALDDAGSSMAGDKVEVSGRMNLYAVVIEANWLHFYENVGDDSDSDATYTGPVFIAKDEVRSSKKPSDPTRKGYTFGGWYTDEACTSAFNWDETGLEKDTDLYAKWEPDKADLTVIVWKQKVTDAKDAADSDKTYDFDRSEVKNGKTGDTVDLSEFAAYENLEFDGFHYSRMEASPEKIKADGTTVVNVYYDRNLNTIQYDYYKNVGYMIPRYELDKTEYMTGLYGQTLAQNNYTWPDEYNWYHGDTHLTFLDSFKETSTTLRLSGYQEGNGNLRIRHYKQNINGTYPDNPTNQTRESGGTWNFTEKYDGFTVAEYRLGDRGAFTATSAGESVSYNSNLYIHYTRNKYTLTFLSEGEKVGEKTDIPFEDILSGYKISDPKKAHYDFKGWCEDPAGTRLIDWNSTMPAANKVVYAKWEPKEYHISLDANGGEFQNAQVGEFNVPLDTILDKTSLLQNVTKEDHELIGWFDKETGNPYGYGKVEEDVNLIAKWRYPGQVEIVYDAGDHGSGEPVDSYKYATDSSVVLGPPPTNIDDGYAFIGWSVKGKKYYVNNTFDITEDIIDEYDKVTKTGKINVTAIYQDLSKGAYETTTITYHPNYEGGGDPVVVEYGSDGKNKLLVNEPVYALTLKDTGFSRNGYEFKGWNTMPDGSGLDVSEEERIAADVRDLENNKKINTLYAQWERTYTVVYNDGVEEEEAFADQKYENLKEGDKTPAFEGTPTRTGYEFVDWSPLVEEKVQDKDAVDGVITYKAIWDALEYTLTYEYTGTVPDGAPKVPDPEKHKYKDAVTAAEAPTMEGYTFSGWEGVPETMPAENVTVTGSWTINKHKVIYKYTGDVPEGAPTVPAEKEYEYNADVPAAEVPKLEGYTFSGWDGEVTKMPDEDVEVTGSWTINEYTLTYEYTGEIPDGAPKVPDPEKYKYKDAVTAAEAPTMEGYTFSGWKGVPDTMPAEDVTVKGEWVKSAAAYKVEHYLENADNNEFELKETEEFNGEVGKTVEAEEKSFDGFTFDKENTNNVVSGEVTADDGLVLKLYYTRNVHKVTYEYEGEVPEGATELPKEAEYKFGEKVTVAEDAVAEGYTFSGWSKTGEFEMPASDVTIKGSWTKILKNYKVSYAYIGDVPEGAPAVPAEREYQEGSEVTVEAVPTFDGYTFNGWSKKGTFVMPAENVILTGSWTKDAAETFDITYDLNGGTYKGSKENIVETYEKGTEISIHEAPEREGYTFDYWKGSEYQPGDKYTVTEDHTFTAQWKKVDTKPKKDDKKKDNTPKKVAPTSVKTGDNSPVMIWLMLLLVSMTGLVVSLFYRRKRAK